MTDKTTTTSAQTGRSWFAIILLATSIVLVFTIPAIRDGTMFSGCSVLQWHKGLQLEKYDGPGSSNLSDACLQFEAYYRFNAKELAQGRLPLWNPHQGFGTPHLANMQSQVFWPPAALVYLLGFEFGLVSMFFLKLLVAGLFTYLFIQRLTGAPTPSLIGAVAFTFCGFNAAWLYFPLTNVIFFLPLSYLLIDRIFASPQRSSNYILLSFGFAIAVFGGHPEPLFQIVLVAIAFTAYRLFQCPYDWSVRRMVLFRLSLSALLGIALSAQQWIPFLEYLHSSEADEVLSTRAPDYLRWFHLPLLAIPDLYGNYALRLAPGVGVPYTDYYLPIRNLNETIAGYVGITTLFLAFVASITFWRIRLVRFFALGSVIVLCVSHQFPGISDLAESIPGLNGAHVNRLPVAHAFFAAVLAGLCLSRFENLRNSTSDKRRMPGFLLIFVIIITATVILGVIGAWEHVRNPEKYQTYVGTVLIISAFNVALLICVFRRAMRTGSLMALGLLVFLETGGHAALMIRALDPAYQFPRTPLVTHLLDDDSHGRLLSLESGYFPILPSNVSTYYGLHDFGNYDALLVGDYVDSIRSNSDAIIHRGTKKLATVAKIEPDFGNMVGIDRFIARSRDELVSLVGSRAADPEEYPRVYYRDGVGVFESSRALDRAYFAPGSEEVLEADPAWFVENAMPARISVDRPRRVEIEVYAPLAGYLVLADTYYPGWTATVNGRAQQIRRVTGANARAVPLATGSNTVVFSYTPRSFTFSLYVCALGGVMAVGWSALAVRGRHLKTS